MKYRVKISNISFDMELEEVKEPIIEIPSIPVEVPVQSPVIPVPVEIPDLEIPVEAPVYTGMERIDISGSFIGNDSIHLDPGKHYWGGPVSRQTLLDRDVRILCADPINKPILEFGFENYSPVANGNQEGDLFWMHNNSTLIIDNVDICQADQQKTVQIFNPRILSSAAADWANWTAIIRNCDTTRLGKNGGFGIGSVVGSSLKNHLALLDFKHWGVGLIDAKNPYENGVLYVTMRNVDAYLQDDARISPTSFQHIGSLNDNVIEFDGDVYSFTSGYNFKDRDNFSYLMLWDRFTFFLDGYKADTVQGPNKFKLRPQAEGKCNFGVLNSSEIYSNEYEMHAGDTFNYLGVTYTVRSKNRINHPWFDSRTTESKSEPSKARAIVYRLDQNLPLGFGFIEIEYKGKKIEFTNKEITFSYVDNQEFLSDINTKYRQSNLISSRGIGHLSYSHSTISMDAQNVKHLGPYRGSEAGKGKSLIWNLYNVEGMEEHPWFGSALPVTHQPDLPLHPRIKNLLDTI